MPEREDLRARLLATFRVEAEEHLAVITANLSALDRDDAEHSVTADLVEATFRAMHTLKGAARSVGLLEVEAVCQAAESILSAVRRGHSPVTAVLLGGLWEAADAVRRLLAGTADSGKLRDLIARLGQRPVSPPSVPAGSPESSHASALMEHGPGARVGPRPVEEGGEAAEPLATGRETVRVGTAALDGLLRQTEELLAAKLALRERLHEAEDVLHMLAHHRVAVSRARTSGGGGRGEGSGALVEAVAAAIAASEPRMRALVSSLSADAREASMLIDGLLDTLQRVRVMPAAFILDLFPLMVADLARQQGKEIEWHASGAELEVDRKVLEAVKDPLIHIVRNAIDHGIERPEERVQAGKPRRGRVTVTVEPCDGARVEIRVEDDGRGLDPQRVRDAAVRARLMTPEDAAALSDDEACDLVFRSGLSTSPVITAVSGHGLGLAIVKDRIESLDGRVEIETRPSRGMAMRLVVPAAIATFRGLLVQASAQPFLLPLEAVEHVFPVAASAIHSVEGHEAVEWNSRILRVAPLSRVLELPEAEAETPAGDRRPCVVLGVGSDMAGLLVDDVAGEREGLVKELRPPLLRVRNVAGASLLGTGQVVLVLRPTDLLRSLDVTRRARSRPSSTTRTGRGPLILVVDDSITTRTMERNIFETAGYQVRVAADGVEAWTILKSEEIDVVVSDVDMPRLDGIQLTTRIRADRALTELPIVLVTALESREDKERGVEAGANAYVVKSSFDQSDLLEIVRRLL